VGDIGEVGDIGKEVMDEPSIARYKDLRFCCRGIANNCNSVAVGPEGDEMVVPNRETFLRTREVNVFGRNSKKTRNLFSFLMMFIRCR
jgi:hypothetical protein